MQNRNRGGFEVATAFNNDTPLMGPKEMVRVQSESLTMITDVVNWRKIVWQIPVNKKIPDKAFCYWQICQKESCRCVLRGKEMDTWVIYKMSGI